MAVEHGRRDGVAVMAKGSNWPRAGMPRDNTQQTKEPKNMTTVGSDRNKFLGGGGMAVGSLRSPRGMPLHPKDARTVLVASVRGGR